MSGSPGRRQRRATARIRAQIRDPRVRDMFDQVTGGAEHEPPSSHPNGPNVYTCESCKGHTVTRHADDGVTPMFLACRVGSDGQTVVCGGQARSAGYPPPPMPRVLAGLPVWEWYRPERSEYVGLEGPMREHLDRGGLALRGPYPPEWPPEMIADDQPATSPPGPDDV